MRKPSSPRFLAAVVLLVAASGCDESAIPGGPASRGPASRGVAATSSAEFGPDVLVTVNGVPIRVTEVQYVIARKDRGKGSDGIDAARVKTAVEELVDQELARQAAVGAKLDADAEYERKLRFMEAPFVQFQREELSERYLDRELAAKGSVEESELEKYFDEHAAELKSELHLEQILVRHDEAKIRAMKKQIEEGASFDEVAATLFPTNLPEDQKTPWDLGFIRWTQVPAQWRDALAAMKEGDLSDVIAGPKGRFWIVKLVKRQTNESITFAQVKGDIADLLKGGKQNGVLEKAKDELRKKADIVYLREAAPIPAPPEPD